MKKTIGFVLLLLVFVFTQSVTAQELHQVFVLNEGAFNNANSSVTTWNPETGQATQNTFFNANGRPLGDIANYSKLINGKLYVIVSNSNKIEVVNPDTFVSEEIIFLDEVGGNSPAVMAQVDENRAYITNLSGNHISILDLNSHTVTGSFVVGSNPEGIAVAGSKAYVAVNAFGIENKVAVIDTDSDELLYHIIVHDNPRKVYLGDDGMIWVVCTGNYGFDDEFNFDPDLETFGEIHIIDPQTDEVANIIVTGGHPNDMVFDYGGQLGYVINNGIQVVELDTFTAREEKLSDNPYYSLAFWGGDDPRIFAGLAPSFSSAGSVEVLNTDGTLRSSFTAGIGPSFFQFIYDDISTGTGGRELANQVRLEQNYPNPFNPVTTIRFELDTTGPVKLEVFNMLGQRAAVLVDEIRSAGSHHVTFQADGLSSGVYMYRLQVVNPGGTGVGSIIQTRRMTLVK